MPLDCCNACFSYVLAMFHCSVAQGAGDIENISSESDISALLWWIEDVEVSILANNAPRLILHSTVVSIDSSVVKLDMISLDNT